MRFVGSKDFTTLEADAESILVNLTSICLPERAKRRLRHNWTSRSALRDALQSTGSKESQRLRRTPNRFWLNLTSIRLPERAKRRLRHNWTSRLGVAGCASGLEARISQRLRRTPNRFWLNLTSICLPERAKRRCGTTGHHARRCGRTRGGVKDRQQSAAIDAIATDVAMTLGVDALKSQATNASLGCDPGNWCGGNRGVICSGGSVLLDATVRLSANPTTSENLDVVLTPRTVRITT